MAELASGAVSSLLGVIRNEQRLLSGVKGDVQFIKEEMESMNSFLLHLARTAPADGEHDEQVRTWMSQVRLLAQDCNSCIDLYLYRGNPDIHLARSGLRRYLWLVPWFVQKMIAQRSAAIKLRELKDRAREVGERRQRYGVEVPGKKAAAETAPAPSLEGGDEEDGGDKHLATMAIHHSGLRGAVFEPPTLDDYFHRKLVEWMKKVNEGQTGAKDGSLPLSIAVVTSDTGTNAARALARQALDVAEKHFECRVLVDVPAMHFKYRTVYAQDVLYYILWKLEHEEKEQGEEEEPQGNDWRAAIIRAYKRRRRILWSQVELKDNIQRNIREMKVDEKIEKVKGEVGQLKGHQLQLGLERLEHVRLDQEALGTLMLRLRSLEQVHVSETWYDDLINATSEKLKDHMEAVEQEEESSSNKQHMSPICVDTSRYEQILKKVFQMASSSKHPQAQEQETSITMLGEDQMKEIIDKVKLEILREIFQGTSTSKPLQAQEQSTMATTSTLSEEPLKETNKTDGTKPGTIQQLQEDKSDTKQATYKPGEDQIPDASIEDTIRKIKKIRLMIIEQMKIKWMVDKIKKDHLKGKGALIILKIDRDYVFEWEETRTALSQLGCVAAVVVSASESTQWAKKYCNPLGDPLDYSLVGLYHDIVLELTRQQMFGANDPQIFRDILDKCESHEFSMKIFAHALYSNPKRSIEELCKLDSTLQDPPKSLGNTAKKTESIAKKMFKFSYNDLPKEYKSCFLYLAIFPPGFRIRRSTLIGRWVAEGLIATDDWRWSSSVGKAERCFGVLLDRWLVHPVDYGATGKVKSCIMGDQVHELVTKIAKKQHIVETRLSLHLAQHFSIFNDLHLRGSDKIETFFKHIPEWSQLSQLKVLDLEGCRCFQKNDRRHLKDIFNTILLLKYLSLRGTDITHLPSEINNLRDLEVLDIRQTQVPVFATRNVMLLKLKRLLADSVWIPEKIEKMISMEVLSNVKAHVSQDLKEIGKLWQLRKLGVVIEDKDSHLRKLCETFSDLHECLMSLSITLSTRRSEGSIGVFPLKYYPKLLESLSLSGTKEWCPLLKKTLVKDANKLNKVTLTRTSLTQNDLEVLAMLPNLFCFRLHDIECAKTKLAFTDNEFRKLEYFLVEKSNLTEISFENGAHELRKVVLSSTKIESINGVDCLKKLEELELNNNSNLLPIFDNANQIAKVTLRSTMLTQVDLHTLTKKSNMRCLVLMGISCEESRLTFDKDDFPKLNLLIVDCRHITKIIFNSGSAPNLEKIVWNFTKMESLSGINNLLKLKELEFNGGSVLNEVKEAIEKHKNKPHYKHNEIGNQNQENGDTTEADDNVARFSFNWIKNKVWH